MAEEATFNVMVSESKLTPTAFTSVQLQILCGFKDALVALFHEVGLPVPPTEKEEEEEEEVEGGSGAASGHAATTEAAVATAVLADSADSAEG